MNKFLFLCLLLLFALPSFSHGEDVSFESNESKNQKVTLDKIAVRTIGIETQKVEEKTIDDVVKTTGQIEEIPNNHFDINCPVVGKVSSILVDLGDKITEGQSLAIIQSTDIAKLQSEIKQFEAEYELGKINFERENKLFEQGISAKKELDAAKAYLSSIEAKLNAAKSNLRILTDQATDLEQGTFTIKSKKPGTIVERNITLGQIVNSNQILFRAIDLSNVLASADIYEKDHNKIKMGQTTYVTLDGIPNKVFEGKITYVGSVINKETRTLPVKVFLHNNQGLLKPGAFIQLLIHTGEKKKSIIIPHTALVEIDKEGTEGKHKHLVYVKRGNAFSPRNIEVEMHDSNNVEVISGLIAGEIIVTQGAYQLQYDKSEDDHEHIKQSKNIPSWLIVALVILALVLGFLYGKKKAK